MSPEEARREARARWTAEKFELGEASEDADVLYWASIPVEERARAVWEVSLETWSLIDPDVLHEPGLCRSVSRVVRSAG